MLYINIKELLKEKGKTKYWLIKNMEGGYQSISHMMNNETTGIKFETIEKLCKLLECEPNDLFKIKQKKHNCFVQLCFSALSGNYLTQDGVYGRYTFP